VLFVLSAQRLSNEHRLRLGIVVVVEVVDSWQVSQSRVGVSESRGQFRNRDKGESTPLDAVTRRLVKPVTKDLAFV
jgi:hypothetical protein